MLSSTPVRRLMAALAGSLAALAGAAVIATPAAAADDPDDGPILLEEVVGTATCNPDRQEWTVDWLVGTNEFTTGTIVRWEVVGLNPTSTSGAITRPGVYILSSSAGWTNLMRKGHSVIPWSTGLRSATLNVWFYFTATGQTSQTPSTGTVAIPEGCGPTA
ncbi:hypothetical protein [Pseudosporangium ferrugineum]|uniref:Uncharacterized protein n=1 Tax=Pseudosporangium ferrugineum TaxID=439699 RepID=A0A2T0S378_9ACTN|nr:hypothetical protein [Pseudosporangium ferrugineum]PRY27875.1 hypothetical protein CLV70_10929 [Pseudosporangium ferrugineum]